MTVDVRRLFGLMRYRRMSIRNITLHDGARPNIVLQPDLTRALSAFTELWQSLTAALLLHPSDEDSEQFPMAGFEFGLHPRPNTSTAPYLSWNDGLELAASAKDSSATSRSVASCAMHCAPGLDISATMAGAFGAVCGFLAGGCMAFAEWQEPCDIAASVLAGEFWHPGAAWQAAPDPRLGRYWDALAPDLWAATRLFAEWSLPGAAYPTLRAAWRRGRSIELNRG